MYFFNILFYHLIRFFNILFIIFLYFSFYYFISIKCIIVKNSMSCHRFALTLCHKLIHFPVTVSGAIAPVFNRFHLPSRGRLQILSCAHLSAASAINTYTSAFFHISGLSSGKFLMIP